MIAELRWRNSSKFRDQPAFCVSTAYGNLPLIRTRRSGHLNAKQRELMELQAKAQARLAKARARFADGMNDAREVRADLEWTQKKVS